MADKKENIIYSKTDIESYLQGNMSKDAMHLMERAALQDPFLADAIEGYSFANVETSTKDLADIETMLLANKPKTKVVEIKQKNNDWLRIAIVALLFVGGGWISILLMDNSNTKSIASNENASTSKIENNQEKQLPAAKDSMASTNAIAKIDEKSKAQQLKSLDKNGTANGTLNATQTDASFGVASTQKQADERLDDVNMSNTKQVASANVATNQTSANSKTAGPSANNNVAYYNYNATNNAKADIAAKEIALEAKDVKDAEKFKNDSKANYATNSSTSVINLHTIKVKRDSTIEAIPVTGYFSKKQAAKPIAFKLSKEDSLSVPVNGWGAFNDYLQKNSAYKSITYDTAYSPVTIINQRTGEEIVGLEFDVDNDGKPQKIKVTQSVDEETDAKAIELLKNGPKWQASKKKSKGKVVIKF